MSGAKPDFVGVSMPTVEKAPNPESPPQNSPLQPQDHPPPPPGNESHRRRRLGWCSTYDRTHPGRRRQPEGWWTNDRNTLLIVATLITSLTYMVGTNPPGGCWQDDVNGHFAGNPIMKDRHWRRYWLFVAASLVGFANSMLLTMWLLIGMPADCHLVRLSFVVAYSSLQLTFITSIPGSSLSVDLTTWVCLMGFLWAATHFHNWNCVRNSRPGDDEMMDQNGAELEPMAKPERVESGTFVRAQVESHPDPGATQRGF